MQHQQSNQTEAQELYAQADEAINGLLMLSQQRPETLTLKLQQMPVTIETPQITEITPSRQPITNVYSNQNNSNVLLLPPIQTMMSHHNHNHQHCCSNSASPSMAAQQKSPFEELIKAAMAVRLPESPVTPSRKRPHSTTITIPTKYHEYLDDKKLACTYAGCDKIFGRIEHLKRHMRIHTGQKDYACKVMGCQKTFNRSDNLLQHMKTHLRRGDINELI